MKGMLMSRLLPWARAQSSRRASERLCRTRLENVPPESRGSLLATSSFHVGQVGSCTQTEERQEAWPIVEFTTGDLRGGLWDMNRALTASPAEGVSTHFMEFSVRVKYMSYAVDKVANQFRWRVRARLN